MSRVKREPRKFIVPPFTESRARAKVAKREYTRGEIKYNGRVHAERKSRRERERRSNEGRLIERFITR